MQTRRIVLWVVLIIVAGIAISRRWDSISLPGGFSGFLLALVGVLVIWAIVRVVRYE
jgi:hypothetical protein